MSRVPGMSCSFHRKDIFFWTLDIYEQLVDGFPLVNTSRCFPHSWLITGFVTVLTRRVSLMEQELPTLPQHSSPPVFSGFRVTRSLVLCVCFVDRCLSFCTFSFGHWCFLFFFDIRILITPLISSNSSYVIYWSIIRGVLPLCCKVHYVHYFSMTSLNVVLYSVFVYNLIPLCKSCVPFYEIFLNSS